MLNSENSNFLQKSLSFFKNLSTTEQEKIVSSAKHTTYQKGNVIHSGLNECNGVIIVKSGSLRAYLLSEQGKEVTIFKLQAGDVCVLTAGCIIKNISFEIFISSEVETQVILLDRKVYEQLKQNHLEVEQFTNDILNQRFSDTMWAIEKILFLSFDKRLAMFLLEQSQTENSTTLNITHSEIANNIGSAREVVTRMLNYFATDNILQLSKGKIEILDIKRLRSLL